MSIINSGLSYAQTGMITWQTILNEYPPQDTPDLTYTHYLGTYQEANVCTAYPDLCYEEKRSEWQHYFLSPDFLWHGLESGYFQLLQTEHGVQVHTRLNEADIKCARDMRFRTLNCVAQPASFMLSGNGVNQPATPGTCVESMDFSGVSVNTTLSRAPGNMTHLKVDVVNNDNVCLLVRLLNLQTRRVTVLSRDLPGSYSVTGLFDSEAHLQLFGFRANNHVTSVHLIPFP